MVNPFEVNYKYTINQVVCGEARKRKREIMRDPKENTKCEGGKQYIQHVEEMVNNNLDIARENLEVFEISNDDRRVKLRGRKAVRSLRE